MGFFDLNIPYNESLPTNKTTRIKLVIKAMELGYSGIAYNRTIKGVMSDRDRCSISLLTLSALLKLAPSLSSSVEFRRDLLGVPRTSPFRQYTRLTVCVGSPSQAQALNSGNPILKTYDLVALRPLNQIAFDQACEKSEVDIIAIDFTEKLPFRLKLPMVKAAIQRGVYFEITYSNLIGDLQMRRQMISNSKLLVDWTRGKNLIFSSAAPSVNELRGPNDVSNLTSLLGLSTERAKASISKNCSTLLANALRKKHFYKEAVKVEVISPGEKYDWKKPFSGDWLKWDPISSGEGDLLLEDIAKFFISSSKVSETAKAIDFTSIIDRIPSLGFQVKDVLSGSEAASKQPDNDKHHSVDLEYSQMLTSQLDSANGFTEPEEVKTSGDELRSPKNSMEEKPKELDIDLDRQLIEVSDMQDCQLRKCISSNELNIVSTNENARSHILNMDIVLDPAFDDEGKVINSTLSGDLDFDSIENKEKKELISSVEDSSEANVTKYNVINDVVLENREDVFSALHVGSVDRIFLEDQFRESGEEANGLGDQVSYVESYDKIEVKDHSSIANHESAEVIMEEQKQEEANPKMKDPILVQSTTGKFRAKRRTSHGVFVFPFKRQLHPITFKKKGHKTKNKFKML